MRRGNIAIWACAADLGVSLWSYFKLSNYQLYIKTIKPYLSSPDFQLQIYQVLMQTLTFSLLLFLLFHVAIYWQFTRGKQWAIKYVRIYTLLACLSCLFSALSLSWEAFIPLFLYAFIFFTVQKEFSLYKTT